VIVLPRTFEIVWKILQKHCGAGDDESASRQEFLINSPKTVPDHEHLEFRFMGVLGGGGKIRYSYQRHFYVDCYPEDATPERRVMIDAANEELKSLKILDHMDLAISDEQAEQCLRTCNFPLYRGKNGLIVVRLDPRGLPLGYWHDAAFEADFDEGHAEYPFLFKTLRGAKARLQKILGDPCPPNEKPSLEVYGGEYSVVLAEWMHPDWQIGHPIHTKYSRIKGQYPGSPQQ
jgi:hypothetical protein